MAEVHSFKVDDKYGVPDRLLKIFLDDCETKLGLIHIFMHQVTSGTANLLTVVVVKAEDVTITGD
jgi:hypothetical protein